MIKQLKDSGRFGITVLLVVMSLFCFSISVFRYIVTDTGTFLFLNWNLFLAFVPWVISSIVVIKGLNNKYLLALLVASWLLFFPNSPYILTDLFHLRARNVAPIWFDLVVILSFAWTGLMYGFISLMDIEKLLKKYINSKLVNTLTILFLFMAGFGIYLGRYLRWNSWDIVNNPFALFSDIFDRLINPFDHPATWGMTILMGVLLNMMYFSIKLLREPHKIL